MRKVFWCCLAAGAAVCCAFWAASYVSQNPDSSIGRVALVATHLTSETAPPEVAHPTNGGAVETDELIPPEPVPVNDAPPKPTPGAQVPPGIANMLTPPLIVVPEEEPLRIFSNLTAKTESKPASSTVEVAAAPVKTVEVSQSMKPHGLLIMPYCKDAEDAPIMPRCAEDEVVPAMPPAPAEDMEKVSGAARPQFDALAFWMGFFSAPAQLRFDQTYTAEKTPFPGGEETSEPPAKVGRQQINPLDLFSHSRHLQTAPPADSESDTMEMRPSDWKPYSLDPGPF
jgi:hypothetical protein